MPHASLLCRTQHPDALCDLVTQRGHGELLGASAQVTCLLPSCLLSCFPHTSRPPLPSSPCFLMPSLFDSCILCAPPPPPPAQDSLCFLKPPLAVDSWFHWRLSPRGPSQPSFWPHSHASTSLSVCSVSSKSLSLVSGHTHLYCIMTSWHHMPSILHHGSVCVLWDVMGKGFEFWPCHTEEQPSQHA